MKTHMYEANQNERSGNAIKGEKHNRREREILEDKTLEKLKLIFNLCNLNRYAHNIRHGLGFVLEYTK